jgi:mono/diheme cytochrome c family protein
VAVRRRHLLLPAAALLACGLLAGPAAPQTATAAAPAPLAPTQPPSVVSPPPAAPAPVIAEPPQVARGRYLAIVGDCEGCHDRPGGVAYSGGLPLNTPFGVIYTANITPDRETGIGSWSADDFWNALHNGKRPNGAHLYPAFPYPYFTHASRGESDALYAYLKTVAPVSYRPPANKLPFPLNIRFMVSFWNLLYFKPGDGGDARQDPGEHIVKGLGHCGACHTPKTMLGGDKGGRLLQGGRLDNWLAPALNADPRRGLGAWSAPDVVEYLKTGRNARANASASMADVVTHSTSKMTDADLSAVAVYLKSVTADRAPPAPRPDPRAMAAGQAIYVDQCSACHKVDGTGEPRFFPALKGAAVTQSDDPTTVVRFILSGTQTVPTAPHPTPLSMPTYGWKLTDQQVADVATYIRNAWGNSAPVVRPGDVASLRKKVAAKPVQKPSAKV